MGYLVGGQCFSTEIKASNYKMSQVVPTITQDGRLLTPVFRNEKWYFTNEEIQLTFPECDPTEYFYDGLAFATNIVVFMLLAWFVRIIIKMIWGASDTRGGDD